MIRHRLHAVNTAPDSENRIHSDAVAAQYGFHGGLVPGVTVYGYMTLPVIEHYGEEWLERGAMTVRLKSPVYDGEEVAIAAQPDGQGRLQISVDDEKAVGLAWMHSTASPQAVAPDPAPLPPENARPLAAHETLAKGTRLGTLTKVLDLKESRVSAPLASSVGTNRSAHPAKRASVSCGRKGDCPLSRSVFALSGNSSQPAATSFQVYGPVRIREISDPFEPTHCRLTRQD